MTEFAHGGDVETFAKKVGCCVDEVIDLSSNIHFNSPIVKIDLLEFKSYPKYDRLYTFLATKYKVTTDCIEVFNGGSSAIFSLFKFFRNKDCVIYSPAYLEYKKAAKINEKNITYINRFENISEDIKENSLVVFVNPSTPDGSFYDMEKYLELWQEKNATILIDESFIEFTDKKSIVDKIDKYENLYILKSLTKFYGCAGIRCGIVVSNEYNIEKLKAQEPQWKISHYDSTYIQKMLEDDTFETKTKKEVFEAKTFLYDILKESNHFEKIYESEANFFLVKLKNLSTIEFQKRLEPYKIMVRDCSNFDFLDSSFIRIAVKEKKDSIAFNNALNQI